MEPNLTDDYALEINETEVQLERMAEAEEDPKEIAEVQMQLEILKALYARATDLYQWGLDDLELSRALTMRGYGEWSFDNVYAFVYETSVALPAGGHHSFVGEIRETDFASVLEAITGSG